MPVVGGAKEVGETPGEAIRLWWPSEYVDESMPAGHPSPDGWLCRLDDGAHAYGIPGGVHYRPQRLAEGQVILFDWQDEAGSATLTIGADGEFRCEPQPACGTFLYIEYEPEICGDTPKEIVGQLIEGGEPEGKHDLRVTRISRSSIPHRFTAADGRARFVAIPSEGAGEAGR